MFMATMNILYHQKTEDIMPRHYESLNERNHRRDALLKRKVLPKAKKEGF